MSMTIWSGSEPSQRTVFQWRLLRYLNKRHWNTVLCDGSLPDQMVIDMLEDSYDLVVERLQDGRPAAREEPVDRGLRGRPGRPDEPPAEELHRGRADAVHADAVAE